MPLPMKRYVDIKSGEGTTNVGSRNLQALALTASSPTKSGYTFDENNDLVFGNAEMVAYVFGEGSKEALWAAKYFGYSSPIGYGPTLLTFAKIGDGDEDPVDAFDRVVHRTNDFGIFTILEKMTTAQIADVAVANKALNYRFQFVSAIYDSLITSTVADLVTTIVGNDGVNGTHLVYQRHEDRTHEFTDWSGSVAYAVGDKVKNSSKYYVCKKKIAAPETGTNTFNADDWTEDKHAADFVPKTYILAAVLAGIDWQAEDGTVSPMFRMIPGETADVTNELTVSGEGVGADDLDKAFVSYYGLVQTTAQLRAFYQKGVNTDREPALVYMGEVWLKSEISTAIMNLMLSLPKIKANREGNAQVYATVDAAASRGVTNGIIEKDKILDNEARQSIYSRTHDTAAANIIETRGYWLKTWIVKDTDGANYKAKYLLLYAKGDVIVKVEGSDILY